MTLIRETVAVWTSPSGQPKRLVCHGKRYRLSDIPTLLEPEWAFVTHPTPVPPT